MSTVLMDGAKAIKNAKTRRFDTGQIGYPVIMAIFLLFLTMSFWWVWADSGNEATRALGTLGQTVTARIYEGVFWLSLAVIGWRAWSYIRYRSIPAVSDAELPMITVVVPAYNEGRHVMDTLVNVASSRYPAEKLQIIAVDDGSKDDTWQWMRKAETELGGRVEIFRMQKNGGKRRALYQGFKMAKGEVLVTIDSDSMVAADTLRNLVSPFVRDKRIGGMAGNVRVLNLKEGFFPRIMDVAFTFSFDFFRIGQSSFNTVFCTPGALSAYRADALAPYLDAWLDETFMGLYANIGEDRGLANIVLRQGYHILFQQNAMVYTNVPTQYKPLCRMLIRWGRSHVRETIVMASFLFTNFRKTPALGARIEFLLQMLELTALEALKFGSLALAVLTPLTMIKGTLIGCSIAALVPGTVYLLRHRSLNCLWALPYTIFYFFGLSWISLWSLLTPHRSGWLTREIKSATLPKAQPAADLMSAAAHAPLLNPAPVLVDARSQAQA